MLERIIIREVSAARHVARESNYLINRFLMAQCTLNWVLIDMIVVALIVVLTQLFESIPVKQVPEILFPWHIKSSQCVPFELALNVVKAV